MLQWFGAWDAGRLLPPESLTLDTLAEWLGTAFYSCWDGKGKNEWFFIMQTWFFFFFALESDVAGVKIWYRIYALNVKISTATKSHQRWVHLPTLTKFKISCWPKGCSWWYLGCSVVVFLFVTRCRLYVEVLWKACWRVSPFRVSGHMEMKSQCLCPTWVSTH